MSRFAILALCVQACLIQAAVSCNCGGQISYGQSGLLGNLGGGCGVEQVSYQGAAILPSYSCAEQISYQPQPSVGYGVAVSAPSASLGCYGGSYGGVSGASAGSSKGAYGGSFGGSFGGSGTGEVSVAGEIGASGQTIVQGSVPVLGVAEFCGTVPAYGSVSISGQCGCGCSCQ